MCTHVLNNESINFDFHYYQNNQFIFNGRREFILEILTTFNTFLK